MNPSRTEPAPWRPSPFAWWALASLGAYLVAAAATWRWFDLDEFMYLQQARRVADGATLFLATPSTHPPLYADPFLRLLIQLPLPALAVARVANALMAWAAGALLAHLFWQRGHASRAAWFLALWSLHAFVLFAGTKALNETPVLFLAALAYYVLVRWDAGHAAGALLGVALLARFTTFFFLPVLFALPIRRAIAAGAVAAGTASVLLAAYLGLHGIPLSAFVDQTVRFHAGVPASPVLTLAQHVALGTGLVVLALIAWAHPAMLRLPTRHHRAGAATLLGAASMAVVGELHPHYFLPLAPVITAAVVDAVHRPRPATPWPRAAWAVVFVAFATGQAYSYADPGPDHDLDAHARVAQWVDANTPPAMPILADSPQHAVLAHRDNLDGYYWSLARHVNGTHLAARLDQASVVVLNHQHAPAADAFPLEVAARLDEMPCLRFPVATVYWTGAAGDAPAGMAATCPVIT